ncbi:hypothetical protein ACFPYJ_22710 [Paenibacillus solisilvae]|uniref:DUF1835 domain-containing protein n=1 Tax=Paenibacillus solisilvae TaxID=2486751 RepID=A0ABW0W665_9BACL
MMLHVTNGDSAANLLRESGMEGLILPWRETWLDGPAAGEWYLPAAIKERSAWLEAELGIPSAFYIRESGEQLAQLEQAVQDELEIVLWFEYDLFDQTILAALLYWFACCSKRTNIPPKLSWIIAEDFPGIEDFRGLGQLTAKQLASLWPLRSVINEKQLAAGAHAWEAFSAAAEVKKADQQGLRLWLAGPDAETVPVMAKAMMFHLQRIPQSSNGGIGIVERTTLQEVTASTTIDVLFQNVARQLPMLGMGDLTFWSVLKHMAAEPRPLIVIHGENPLPNFQTAHPIDWGQWRIELTAHGKEVQ